MSPQTASHNVLNIVKHYALGCGSNFDYWRREEEETSLIFTSPLKASLEYPAELRASEHFRCFKFLIFPVILVVKIVHAI